MPAWVVSRVESAVENLQRDHTGEFRDVSTLPAALMPTQVQRTEMERHVHALRRLLSQTPAESEQAEKAVLVIVTKMLLALPAQKTTEEAVEAKGEAYLMALDDVPYWAVAEAWRLWCRGVCGKDERGKPYDYNWAPGPAALRRIALGQTCGAWGRIRALERLLGAQERIESTVELERGRKAWSGLLKAYVDGADLSSLTFDKAVEIGEVPAR